MVALFEYNRLNSLLREHESRINTLERYAASNRFIPYTTGLTASVTDPDLTDGELTAKYVRTGNLVYAVGDINFGTAATAGSGTYRIKLPTFVPQVAAFGGPSPANTYTVLGHWRCTGFGMFEANDIQAVGGTNYMTARYPAAYPVGADTPVTHNQPWGWAATYRISFMVLYEAAT